MFDQESGSLPHFAKAAMFALAITSKRERKSFNEYSGIRKTNKFRTKNRRNLIVEKKLVNTLSLETISERGGLRADLIP